MKTINIGLIGGGFISYLHADSYKKLYGVNVKIKALASIDPNAGAFAKRYEIPDVYTDYREMLKDRDIDVVDICTPVNLHKQMVLDAVAANKHIICEKPMTGFCGGADVGTVSKAEMFRSIKESAAEIKEAIDKSSCLYMYAEDWIYAPYVQKIAEIIKKRKPKLLLFKGEESHSGSHAGHAAHWSTSGGGALIRLGCHPLSTALYLKQVEAEARNEKIYLKSVLCDMDAVTKHISEDDLRYIEARPIDVEDYAVVTMAFSDGTRALITAADLLLGGVRNQLEIYTTDSLLQGNITPNTGTMGYFADDRALDDVYISEKLTTKSGWQYICSADEFIRGYIGELQDFAECVAFGGKPLSDINIAHDTMLAIYAAYASAEEGRRIVL